MSNNDRDDHIILEGVVEEVMHDKFQIKADHGGYILGHLSGKMRKNKIRIILGDRVRVAVSAYDLTKGIIKTRL